MKKIILTIFLLVLCCGCEINYNINIDGDNITEQTSIIYDKETDATANFSGVSLYDAITSLNDNVFPIYYNDPNYDEYLGGKQEGVTYYDQKINQDNYKYKMLYTHTYNLSDFYKSYSVHQCNNSLNISKSENIVKIGTTSKNTCFEKYQLLNKIKVSININKTVLYNDADEIVDNTYYWYIDSTNYATKKVTLYYQIEDSVIITNPEENSTDNPSAENPKNQPTNSAEEKTNEFIQKYQGYIVGGVIIFFISSIFIVIKIKKYKL